MRLLSSLSPNRLICVVAILGTMVGCQQNAPSPDQMQRATPDTTEKREPVEAPAASISGKGAEGLTVLRRSPGKPQIDIDAIASNDHIGGHVTGLAREKAKTLRVLVYVHTDQWYIHPYAAQGEGSSWATLDATLHWQIPSVKRAYTADQVAALLVSSDIAPPPTVGALGEIQALAWVVVK